MTGSNNSNLQQKIEENFGADITYEIWTNIENMILIYVGSAADFALNPEVEWLFYTMRLPEAPQQRFIETLKYHHIIFSMPPSEIPKMYDRIRKVHDNLEKSRSQKTGKEQHISNQAFKEVNDMLIEYGILGYEYLHGHRLTAKQKQDFYRDMKLIGEAMHIQGQPQDFFEWERERAKSIKNRLARNEYTEKLYSAYKEDIGSLKYQLLIHFQSWFVREEVGQKLDLHRRKWFGFAYFLYPLIHSRFLLRLLLRLLMRADVYNQLMEMDKRYTTRR